MKLQVILFHSLDAEFNAMPEVGLVAEVRNVDYLPAPVYLCHVPDHLHGHELTAVSSVVNDGHALLAAHLPHLLVLVKAQIVEHQGAGLLRDLEEPCDERIEAILLVALLLRLSDGEQPSIVDDRDGGNCFERELLPSNDGSLHTLCCPNALLTLRATKDRFVTVVHATLCVQLSDDVRERVEPALLLCLQLLLAQVDLVLELALGNPKMLVHLAQLPPADVFPGKLLFELRTPCRERIRPPLG